MKRIFILILTVALSVASLSACDESAPETPAVQFDAEAWDAVFSTGMLTNVTLTYTLEGDEGQSQIVIKNEADGFYYMMSVAGSSVESYCEHKDGELYGYAKLDGEWIKQKLDGHETEHSQMLQLASFSGLFESFTLDNASGNYTAESITVDDVEVKNAAVKIVDGRLESVAYTVDGRNYTVSYKDYGTTDISFPEARLNEGEGGDFELPIVRK